jgi:aryl-alcohol dehydrogenase-like predicted oxidoreductase
MATRLPGIPIEPSRIVLGSVFFGSDITEEDSFAVMDAFVEAGGNFIDTAHVYAAWLEHGVGASERTIGKWMRARGDRDRVVLATKGAHSPIEAEAKVGRCSKADLEKDLGESLDRLGLEHVDLYWLHLDEPTRPVGEIIEALAELQHTGIIRAYGASNWSTERIQAANDYAGNHDLPPFVASQPWFSLGAVARGPSSDHPTSEADDPLLRWHLQMGLPMIPYSSQANGYFGAENVAWAAAGFDGPPKRAASFDSPANRRRLLRAIALAEQKSCTANQIALAYLLNQSFSVFPIIGTSNPDHAREALGAAGLALTEEERASLLHR